MTLTLELPADLESRLNLEAARRGISPAQCALEVLDNLMPGAVTVANEAEDSSALAILNSPWPEDEPQPVTGAEIVAYWERHGLLGARPDIKDSLAHAQALRRRVERRERD